MEKNFNYSYNEEEKSITLPYWWVRYIDSYGKKHLAQVKEEKYLEYLKNNFIVIEVKAITT